MFSNDNNQNDNNQNDSEEEIHNSASNLIDLLLYSSMNIHNNNYETNNTNNHVYTTNFYSFNTSPITRSSSRLSRRSRNIFDTASNFLLEETFNTLFDTTYGIDFINDNIYDNIYESTINRSFEENRDKELQRKEDEYINFDFQRYDTLTWGEIIKEQKECAICLNDFEKENMISITLCKHIFHHDCIKEWTHYKSNCPVCREELKEELKK